MSSIKIGRNEPCWCGSGVKYKFCHLNREQDTPITKEELLRIEGNNKSTRLCLHPLAGPSQCRGSIAKAHSIQKSGGLDRIAQKGHVYNFIQDVNQVIVGNASSTVARKIGINQASTFTGFCSYHDTVIFKPIEASPFQSTQQHAFLLAYRAVCMEYYLKAMETNRSPARKIMDRGKPLSEQIRIQHVLRYSHLGVDAGADLMYYYKAKYDQALLANDFSDTNYYIVRLNVIPDFLCSGSMLPDFDFHGNILQEFTYENITNRNYVHDNLTFSLITVGNVGAAVFSWIGICPSCEKLVRSLNTFNDEQIGHALLRFTFEYFENIYASPEWWDSLSNSTKNRLLRRQMSEVHPMISRTANSLSDDNIRATRWPVSARETNLNL